MSDIEQSPARTVKKTRIRSVARRAAAAIKTQQSPEPPSQTDEPPAKPEFPVISIPENGIPDLTDSPEALAQMRQDLLKGSGSLAIDTERAQSFRYTAKAYLIQLRRGYGQTILLDPVAFEDGKPRADFSAISTELAEVEWIIHAASNDLPCLTEVGLVPTRLFDTELAGRLLGFSKVNLSALMERFLSVSLAKQHSAEDWSARPIPNSWRAYAALDVERLSDLRDALENALHKAGRYDIAQQEFAHLVAHAKDPVVQCSDPWRRTSGMHLVKNRRSLAVIREIWLTRDEIAAATDTAPGRILNDKALSSFAASMKAPTVVTPTQLQQIPAFRKKTAGPYLKDWVAATNRALALPESELPPKNHSRHGAIHQLRWKSTHPELFDRYKRIRSGLDKLSEQVGIPSSNLLSPEDLRHLIWDCQKESPQDAISYLSQIGAREWQQEISWRTVAANW